MKKTVAWVKFDVSSLGAEDPFLVRAKGVDPVAVILNGHNQVLTYPDRSLISFIPEESAPLSSVAMVADQSDAASSSETAG